MFETTKALVLREVHYKEADRILTLFTSEEGKMTAKARGALRKSSKTAAATQLLTYSEMTLFGNKGRWTVNEASVLEPFSGLRTDIEGFALGCYVAECLDSFSMEGEPDAALLQLGLNTLYALSNSMYDQLHIKAAFETRLMCLSGYEPELSQCQVCGAYEPENPELCLESGGICCRKCRELSHSRVMPLCRDSLAAMRYVAMAPAKQIFSFKLGEEALKRLSEASEQYLLLHAERKFGTLDYWKSLKTVQIMPKNQDKGNET